jgi:hypothetical protein
MPWTPLSFNRAHHAQPFYALMAISGWAAHRASSLRQSSTLFDTPHHTPMNESVEALKTEIRIETMQEQEVKVVVGECHGQADHVKK